MTKRTAKKTRLKIDPAAKESLARAKEDLSVAERELKHTLDALPLALRADKQMVSDGLRIALDKLAAAKDVLESVLEG